MTIGRQQHHGVGEIGRPGRRDVADVDEHHDALVGESTLEPDHVTVGIAVIVERGELDRAAPQHCVVVAQREQHAVERVHRRRITDLRLSGMGRCVRREWQPGPFGPAVAGFVIAVRCPRDRGTAAVATVGIDHALGWHHAVFEAEFLARIQKRRAPDGEGKHGRSSGPGFGAKAGAMARSIVVRQHERRPPGLGEVGFHLRQRILHPVGLPWRVQGPEIERQVEFGRSPADVAEIRGALASSQQVHLAHHHRFVLVAVEQRADTAQQFVAERSVGCEQRHRHEVFGKVVDVGAFTDQVHDIGAEPVDAPVEPVPQRVVHRRFDVGVRPVEVRLLCEEDMEVRLVGEIVVGPCGHALEQ